MSVETIDWETVEAQLAKAAHGDAVACRDLVGGLWPHWLAMARRSRALRGVRAPDESAREVATRLAEKVGRAGSSELRSYAGWKSANPGKGAGDWIRILAANAARDVARHEGGRVDDAGVVEPSQKRLLNEFSRVVQLDDCGARPPVTALQTARQLLKYAADVLAPAQLVALREWLLGATFEQIAVEAGLADAASAQRALRAAIAQLRRRFAE